MRGSRGLRQGRWRMWRKRVVANEAEEMDKATEAEEEEEVDEEGEAEEGSLLDPAKIYLTAPDLNSWQRIRTVFLLKLF